VDVGGKIHALIETEMHIRLSMPRNGGAKCLFWDAERERVEGAAQPREGQDHLRVDKHAN
jgi:hypothetical protein